MKIRPRPSLQILALACVLTIGAAQSSATTPADTTEADRLEQESSEAPTPDVATSEAVESKSPAIDVAPRAIPTSHGYSTCLYDCGPEGQYTYQASSYSACCYNTSDACEDPSYVAVPISWGHNPCLPQP